jgi:hypothetical protein
LVSKRWACLPSTVQKLIDGRLISPNTAATSTTPARLFEGA